MVKKTIYRTDGEKVIDMHIEKGIRQSDIRKVVKWTNLRDSDFLKQYAGDKWSFPLSEVQVAAEKESIYSILIGKVFIGMIQVLKQDQSSVHIGRFLLNPEETGRGIGTRALKYFCRIPFEERNLEFITLNVAETNKAAQRCYQKCGFTIIQKESRNGNSILKMVLQRPYLINSDCKK